MGSKKTRALIAIGGREDKVGSKVILKEVARRIGSGKLVITTVASHQPGGLFEEAVPVAAIEGLALRQAYRQAI